MQLRNCSTCWRPCRPSECRHPSTPDPMHHVIRLTTTVPWKRNGCSRIKRNILCASVCGLLSHSASITLWFGLSAVPIQTTAMLRRFRSVWLATFQEICDACGGPAIHAKHPTDTPGLSTAHEWHTITPISQLYVHNGDIHFPMLGETFISEPRRATYQSWVRRPPDNSCAHTRVHTCIV